MISSNLLTINEVTKKLKCKKEIILYHIRHKNFPAEKIGKNWIINERDLINLNITSTNNVKTKA